MSDELHRRIEAQLKTAMQADTKHATVQKVTITDNTPETGVSFWAIVVLGSYFAGAALKTFMAF